MAESDFYTAVEEWIEHCKKPDVHYSSSSDSARNCSAYRKIVAMGHEALPHVRQLFNWVFPEQTGSFALEVIKAHGLVGIVRDVVGEDFSIPKDIRGRVSEIERYTIRWLDRNMHKYVPKNV